MADLSGLPPILIHAGELELQRDDSLSLWERLKEAGVEAEIKVWPAMVHDFHLFADQLSVAEEANEELRAFLLHRLESAHG
jgi:acetyl esterase/lipase